MESIVSHFRAKKKAVYIYDVAQTSLNQFRTGRSFDFFWNVYGHSDLLGLLFSTLLNMVFDLNAWWSAERKASRIKLASRTYPLWRLYLSQTLRVLLYTAMMHDGAFVTEFPILPSQPLAFPRAAGETNIFIMATTSLRASKQRSLDPTHRSILALSHSCDLSWVAFQKISWKVNCECGSQGWSWEAKDSEKHGVKSNTGIRHGSRISIGNEVLYIDPFNKDIHGDEHKVCFWRTTTFCRFCHWTWWCDTCHPYFLLCER